MRRLVAHVLVEIFTQHHVNSLSGKCVWEVGLRPDFNRQQHMAHGLLSALFWQQVNRVTNLGYDQGHANLLMHLPVFCPKILKPFCAHHLHTCLVRGLFQILLEIVGHRIELFMSMCVNVCILSSNSGDLGVASGWTMSELRRTL